MGKGEEVICIKDYIQTIGDSIWSFKMGRKYEIQDIRFGENDCNRSLLQKIVMWGDLYKIDDPHNSGFAFGAFTMENFHNHFMDINDWREKQIDSIT